MSLPIWSNDLVPMRTEERYAPPRHIHLIASMHLGGAERIILDIAQGVHELRGYVDIIVLHQSRDAYTHAPRPGIRFHYIHHLHRHQQITYIAGIAAGQDLPIYTHLIRDHFLADLWKERVHTIPVIHNDTQGWKNTPTNWQDNPHVPAVIACGQHVAQSLTQHGYTGPIHVIRHAIPPIQVPTHQAPNLRHQYGWSKDTMIIGMVGRIVPQKHYTHAIRILHGLTQQEISAQLVIIGGVNDEDGKTCARSLLHLAKQLNVLDKVTLLGPVPDARIYYPEMDIYLNTAQWEGVSIATMEALAANLPCITSDIPGNEEAGVPANTRISKDAPISAWVNAIISHPTPSNAQQTARNIFHYTCSRWGWTANQYRRNVYPQATKPTLFITGNMDVGGAQRSLCNLACAMHDAGSTPMIAIAGAIGVPAFLHAVQSRYIPCVHTRGTPAHAGGIAGRVGRLLHLIHDAQPQHIVFWNMDPTTKVLLTDILTGHIPVTDVSPGPMLYSELNHDAEKIAQLGGDIRCYLQQLTQLITKQPHELFPFNDIPTPTMHSIANGVPIPTPDPSPVITPPNGYDPAHAYVIVGRLVPAKRPDLLIPIAQALQRRCPSASLTVIGGTHGTDKHGVWDMLQQTGIPDNLKFVGPHAHPAQILHQFAGLLMFSTDQGCPNASLEAMAAGLPVIANPDGGTAEQVKHGITGYLVPDPGTPTDYAEHIVDYILTWINEPDTRRDMGIAARTHVTQAFSMQQMAHDYIQRLAP